MMWRNKQKPLQPKIPQIQITIQQKLPNLLNSKLHRKLILIKTTHNRPHTLKHQRLRLTPLHKLTNRLNNLLRQPRL
ncbi:hypothetical protein HanRHA438_Chr17g0823821 [Helianthus annuus]|nr:hypothetical protein HanRHA438_Chr17g0823821 [Helianthus annuus]